MVLMPVEYNYEIRSPDFIRVWRSWVARVPWAHEVVSSNLTTLTILPRA